MMPRIQEPVTTTRVRLQAGTRPQAGDDAPDVDEDRDEGAAAEGGEAQQKPAKAKVPRTERADESGPSPSTATAVVILL